MIFTRPRERREYVLERERDLPPDAQTIFILDDILERDRVRVMDTWRVEIGKDAPVMSGSGTRVYQAVRAGLRGWRNAKYEDGSEVPFETEPGSAYPTDATLALLPWEDKLELSQEILADMIPTEVDKEK